MLRNRENVAFVVISLAIAVAASLCCLPVSPFAGAACLIGCLGVFSACAVFTKRRYRKIAELSDYLDRILRGDRALDIRDNAEGELSILKNEIYRAANALTAQADALSKDKQELASALSDISHQLKTPLTSLGIMAELLEKDNLPPEKRSEFIASVRGGLDHMEWLVMTLLKFARLDADAAGLKRERVFLSALVEAALKPMRIPMEVREQDLLVRGEDAEIWCDINWTAEAITNIVKNAVENTPQGGRLEIAYGANPLYAFLRVKDGGEGIRREDMPHLFKRFYRGKRAGAGGAGIGLAMSLAILKKQNGDIEAANEDGGVFTLKFYKSAFGDKTVTDAATGQSRGSGNMIPR